MSQHTKEETQNAVGKVDNMNDKLTQPTASGHPSYVTRTYHVHCSVPTNPPETANLWYIVTSRHREIYSRSSP